MPLQVEIHTCMKVFTYLVIQIVSANLKSEKAKLFCYFFFEKTLGEFFRWKDKGCKTPYHSCLNLLIDKEDWIISDDNLIQASYIVL